MKPRRPSLAPLHPVAISLGVLAALAGCGEGPPGPGPAGSGSGSAPGAVVGRPVVATSRGPAVAGELVVTLVPGAGDDVAAELAAEVGGRVAWHAPRTGAYLIRFDRGETAAARALPELATRPEVLESTRNVIASGSGIGTSPSNAAQWNLPAMGLDPAGGFGSATGVTIAVLDTGVAFENYSDESGTYALAPDLEGVDFAPGYDFVYDDAHPDDDQGHGTHVAGILTQTGPLTAVAPGATILPVKVLGADDLGTELSLAEGLLYATDHGANVVNMSLSFSPAYFPSRLLQEAFDQASASGVVMVAAAGNHGAPVVTYPAAFRNVIAVGASKLDPSFRSHPTGEGAGARSGRWRGAAHRRGRAALAHSPWLGADRALEVASYSDRGWLLDVTAPGGAIDEDVDGDGNPEAILAQTFLGDPTQFQYVYYAGTSQAAAQVSGLAADMLAQHPGLTTTDIRAALGVTARGDRFWQPLDADTGRGYVRADAALRAAGLVHALHSAPRHFASVDLSLAGAGGADRTARAVVEVVGEDGTPARHVEVYGTFNGGVFRSVEGRTDRDGRVVFESGALDDGRLVAFQVDAVATGPGPVAAIDRPGGFVRIDSCSLDLLAGFADQLASSSGIGTSPSGPIALIVPPSAPGEVETAELVNFSWAGATPAMAVVADRAWLGEAYPEATLVTSLGSGVAGDPLHFDGQSSFPFPVESEGDGQCVDLVVRTFTSSGIGTSPSNATLPLLPDPEGSCQTSGSCDLTRELLSDLWGAIGPDGIGTSPSWSPDTGVSRALFEDLLLVTGAYAEFGPQPLSSPVGNYADALEAAGIGTSPSGPEPDPDAVGPVPWQAPPPSSP